MKRKISTNDLAIFLRQFATLINANIPIIQCCETLEKSLTQPAFLPLLQHIKHALASGKPLSSILKAYPHYFDPLIQQLIRLGEHTGRLDHMLALAADHQESLLKFQQKIKQALFYPAILMSISLTMTIAMFVCIIPQFASLFDSTMNKLPALTRYLFLLSSWLQHSSWRLALFIALIAPFIPFKQWLLKQSLTLPILKSFLYQLALTRFCRQFTIAIDAGITIHQALHITINTQTHQTLKLSLQSVYQKLQTGIPLHQAMAVQPGFPPIMIQLIKIGEMSGSLVTLLHKLTETLESDLNELSHRASQLLQPLIMIVLGVLIGGMVIGLYLPVFTLGSAFE